MVTGQRPVSPMAAHFDFEPRCTFGSFPASETWLTVFVNRRNKSEFVDEALPPMKNPYDVLRMKEQELLRVRKEIEALRIAARLLGAEDPAATKSEGQPQLSRVVEMP